MQAADSGLALNYVELVYGREGKDDVASLFKEKVAGRVRVAASEKIIESVSSFFAEKKKT